MTQRSYAARRDFPAQVARHIRTPLYRASYALVLSAGGTAVLGLIYWAAAARHYPASQVGVQSVVLSTMLFLAGLAQLSLNSVLIRFLPVSGGNASRMIRSIYAVSVVAALAAATIFVLGTSLWAPNLSFLRSDKLWFAAFVGATAIWCVYTLQDSALAGLRRATWVPIENIAVSGTKIVLLLLFAAPLVDSGLFASWMLPTVVAVVVVNVFIFRVVGRGSSERAPEFLSFGRIARFAGGNYVGFVFYAASTNLIPLAVLNRVGPTQSAYFILPWTITMALAGVASSTSTSLTVETALDMVQLRSYCRRTLVHTFLLLAAPIALLVIGAPYVLRVFGSGYAEHGATTLRLLSLGVLPNAVVLIGLSVLRIRGNVRRLAGLQGALCFLLLGVSYLLLPRYGITGVGIAYLLSQSATAALLLLGDLKSIVRTAPLTGS